jgi:hypothetical protein
MSPRNKRPQNAAQQPAGEPSPMRAAKVIIIAMLAAFCLGIGILFCLLAVRGLHAQPFTAPNGAKSMVIEQGSAKIDASVGDGAWNVTDTDLHKWIQNAADSVATYYGRFPLDRVDLRISPRGRAGVGPGMTWPDHGGGLIKIRVGADTSAHDFADDWMLTHEMTHLAFPSMPDEHHWIEEGIATYIEPIARVRAHHLDENEMWFEMVRDMHQGLPHEGDQGLDRTQTWANTYWGGALFCFVADVEIHRATHNAKGLDDALRAILAAGGNINVDWSLDRALQTGDRATGTHVLEDAYSQMGNQYHMIDLDAMWKELGVTREGDHVVFNDAASMAATRHSITWGHTTDATSGAKVVPVN